jgi:hypothetical protein
MTFWEYFVGNLERGYVVVPFPNPPAEFVYIPVAWVIAAWLFATIAVWLCLRYVSTWAGISFVGD